MLGIAKSMNQRSRADTRPRPVGPESAGYHAFGRTMGFDCARGVHPGQSLPVRHGVRP